MLLKTAMPRSGPVGGCGGIKIAFECANDPVSRRYIIKSVGREVRNEMKSMCSDASNKSNTKKDLTQFTWDNLKNETLTKMFKYSQKL